ncbi:Mss4-like protein [Echria macrotheca]|uniref:Mss4-like protein n=1 Tax=Echria macrotheca TaxID=438768 RepID=A0AAJ0BHV5_9PEZI|nr:Mss4-like protein [Echria macrotheca]
MTFNLQGRCTCHALVYRITLDSPDDARTTLCHCHSCRRAFGTNYGLTTKIPIAGFQYEKGQPKTYTQDNGVTREFCDVCGVFICEYGEQAKDKFRYVMWGTLDEPDGLPPKGEFFCRERAGWMPEIPDVFHKQEIKE